MYMGWLSVTGTMNVGELAVWRRPLAALGVPLGLPAMGWKSEKTAFAWGWQGVFALEEATLWFWAANMKATVSPGWAVMELGVNWNLLLAATVTIIVAADAVKLWARTAKTMLENSMMAEIIGTWEKYKDY